MVEIQPHLIFHALGFSILSACLGEVINYFLIYNNDNFKRVLKEADELKAQKVAIQEENKTADEKKIKKNEPKLEGIEDRLKKLNEELQPFKMKTAFSGLGIMLLFFNKVGSWYEGVGVARLPFEPWGFFASILNRGIQDDTSVLSFMGCFILCGMIVRAIVPVFIRTGVPELVSGGFAAALADAQKKNQ